MLFRVYLFILFVITCISGCVSENGRYELRNTENKVVYDLSHKEWGLPDQEATLTFTDPDGSQSVIYIKKQYDIRQNTWHKLRFVVLGKITMTEYRITNSSHNTINSWVVLDKKAYRTDDSPKLKINMDSVGKLSSVEIVVLDENKVVLFRQIVPR